MTYTYKQLQNVKKNRELFEVNSKFNHYDVNLAESEEHDKKVLEQFFYLRRRNHYVAVRQKLLTGGIPDIAILDTEEVIFKEILVSESEKRFQEKEYEGKNMESAAVSAFKVSAPKNPGMLTRMKLKTPDVIYPYGRSKESQWNYIDTTVLLKRAGYKVEMKKE